MKVIEAVKVVLGSIKTPMSGDAITKQILKQKLWVPKTKTPSATVSAQINRDIKKNGKKSIFERPAPNTYILRKHNSKTSNQAPTKPVNVPNGGLSYLEAAEIVLKKYGKNGPMHFREITKKARALNLIKSYGKTPWATMNAKITTDIKRQPTAKNPAKFERTQRGYYALVKWKNGKIKNIVQNHIRSIEKKLLSKLLKMSPNDFEDFVAELLPELGFDSVEVTKRTNDGGIDLHCTYSFINGVNGKMAVQVKRWGSKVPVKVVRDFRGSLPVNELGLIITTSDFTKDAQNDAVVPNKVPIQLINGETLISLLLKYEVGVKQQAYTFYEITDE